MVEHLSEMMPGPELAAVLAAVDRAGLDGNQLVSLARARARLIAHLQAELLADMVGITDGYRAPDTPDVLAQDAPTMAALELAPALRWTRCSAETWVELADHLVRDLPEVHGDLHRGLIDLPRARVFSDELTAQSPEAVRLVLDKVLPEAGRLTTGQIRARIRKLLAVANPEKAKQDYQQGLKYRGVSWTTAPEGTTQLYGWGLPTDRAAAAAERLDAMAKAAKQAGDTRSMDQLRADVLLDLLNYQGPAPVHRKGVVELTVPLETLIGLSEAPGEVAGFGPVVADIARQVAHTQAREAVWRYSVLDAEGRVRYHGVTRRRPTGTDAARVRARDRRCTFPGCRVPATHCDIDHRRRYVDGGPSTVDNLHVLCRHHHRAKDERGWKVLHLGDDHYLWTSPLGHTYEVRPEPLQPP